MQTFKWPISRSKEEYKKILSDDNYRGLFTEVLEEIKEKTQEKEWVFDAQEMAEITGTNEVDTEKILKYIYNLKYFRVDEPTLNKEDNKFKTNPRFSKEVFEKTKIKYEILSKQKQLGEYFEGKFPDRKVELNKERFKKIEEILKSLRELRNVSTIVSSWQECLASYELLKFEKGEEPQEREIGSYLGLDDFRLRNRNWGKEIKKRGFTFNPSKNVSRTTTKIEAKRKKIKGALERLKEDKKYVTIEDLRKETKINLVTLRKYVGKMNLGINTVKKAGRKEKENKIMLSYQSFDEEYLPTAIEIAEDVGLSKEYTRDICKDLGLLLLESKLLKKKQLLQTLRKLEEEGEDITMLSNTEILDGVYDEGYDMCVNTVSKWRNVLEDEKRIPPNKFKETMKNKYIKYKDTYLDIIKEKMKGKKRINLTNVAKEVSERFGENVPPYRIWKLRDVTGIPKLLDNEERYQNIVNIYVSDPSIGMVDWAEESKVSIGFLYDALRQFRKNPELLEKFNAPQKITSKSKIKVKPLVKAFKAIGNTNRVKILQSIAETGESTVSGVIEDMEYEEAKWRNTTEYHLDVLEDAGMIDRDNGGFSITEKGEMLIPVLRRWDVEDIVPEEIFGPGYNKPFFALAVSKEEKQLKEIVSFMREKKGYVPFDSPSQASSERHPVHDDEPRRSRFKKYFESSKGVYKLKESDFPFLANIIETVRTVWSPRNLIEVCRNYGVDYMKVRELTIMLADKKKIDEFDIGLPAEESHKYMNFIKDNFSDLCKRARIDVDYKSIKKSYDRRNEMNVLEIE